MPIKPRTPDSLRPTWLFPCDYPPPKGQKVLLLTKGGIAVVGPWSDDCKGWLPLPNTPTAMKPTFGDAVTVDPNEPFGLEYTEREALEVKRLSLNKHHGTLVESLRRISKAIRQTTKAFNAVPTPLHPQLNLARNSLQECRENLLLAQSRLMTFAESGPKFGPAKAGDTTCP